MSDLKQFVKRNGLKMTSEKVRQNPNNVEWKDADHWKCVIVANNSQMTTYFSMGYGHNGKKPDVGQVISVIALDSSALDMMFEDWCDEYGYDAIDWDTGEQNPVALNTYNMCLKNAKNLKRVLGGNAFEELRYDVELD